MKVRELITVLQSVDPELGVAVTNDGWFETCDDVCSDDKNWVYLGPILGGPDDHNTRSLWYDGPVESSPAPASPS
jgi:hypothetical protein